MITIEQHEKWYFEYESEEIASERRKKNKNPSDFLVYLHDF